METTGIMTQSAEHRKYVGIHVNLPHGKATYIPQDALWTIAELREDESDLGNHFLKRINDMILSLIEGTINSTFSDSHMVQLQTLTQLHDIIKTLSK